MARPKLGEPGDAEATAKMKKTMMERYGGPEGFHRKMQEIGRKGGKARVKKGFALNPERARLAGSKGGRISRIHGSTKARKMNAEKQKIIEMVKDGYTKREIAEWLDVSYATFLKWARDNFREEGLDEII